MGQNTHCFVGAGDKDARDFVQMHHETRLREGKDVADWHGIGGFEKYTKV